MKHNAMIILILLLIAGSAFAGDTNLPAPSTWTMMTDSNGVVVAPPSGIDWKASNDLASAASLATLAALVDTNTTTLSNRLDAVEANQSAPSNSVQRIGDIMTGPLRIQSDLIIETVGITSSNACTNSTFDAGVGGWASGFPLVATNGRARVTKPGGAGDCNINIRWSQGRPAGNYLVSWVVSNVDCVGAMSLTIFDGPGSTVTSFPIDAGFSTIGGTSVFYQGALDGSLYYSITLLDTNDELNTRSLDFDDMYILPISTNLLFRLSTNGILYGSGTNIVWSPPSP